MLLNVNFDFFVTYGNIEIKEDFIGGLSSEMIIATFNHLR